MKGKTDFAFGSTAPGTWNLSLEGREPWMLLTLASSADQVVVRAISSNDIELVKQTLMSPGEGLFVRSFQVVADFGERDRAFR